MILLKSNPWCVVILLKQPLKGRDFLKQPLLKLRYSGNWKSLILSCFSVSYVAKLRRESVERQRIWKFRIVIYGIVSVKLVRNLFSSSLLALHLSTASARFLLCFHLPFETINKFFVILPKFFLNFRTLEFSNNVFFMKNQNKVKFQSYDASVKSWCFTNQIAWIR